MRRAQKKKHLYYTPVSGDTEEWMNEWKEMKRKDDDDDDDESSELYNQQFVNRQATPPDSRTREDELNCQQKSILLLDGLYLFHSWKKKRTNERTSLNADDIFPSYFKLFVFFFCFFPFLLSWSMSSLAVFYISFHFRDCTSRGRDTRCWLHSYSVKVSLLGRAPVKKRDRFFFFVFFFLIYLSIYLFLWAEKKTARCTYVVYTISLSPVRVRIEFERKKKVAKQFGHTQSEVPTGGRNFTRKNETKKTKQNEMEEFLGVRPWGLENFPSAIG